jgi:hypothetical protein
MGVVKGFSHLGPDFKDLVGLEGLILLDRAERLSFDIGHDEEEIPFKVREVVDGNNAGVVELGHRARLPLETFALVSLQVSRRQHLDRDFAIKDGIAGKVHNSHAPSTDLSKDFVPRREFATDHKVLAITSSG